MTEQLLESTVREWVRANPKRGARTLDRLTGRTIFHAASASTEEIADALIQLAGRTEIARSRSW
jgi:1,6-anhydro-N-acetylmuramate kinase